MRSLIHDAYDRDFKITVVTDCCTAFDKKTQDFTFQDLKRTREEINFTDINTFILGVYFSEEWDRKVKKSDK